MSKKYRPLYYTNGEGGQWLVWFSDSAVTDLDLAQRAARTVEIQGHRVHSFAFEWPFSTGPFARWDCINGWTERLDGDLPHAPLEECT